MNDSWWETYSDSSAELYRLDRPEKDVSFAAEVLADRGFLYASMERFFVGGLGLLVRHLQQLELPPRDVLRERILAYAHRPRPYLPELSNLGEARNFAEHSFHTERVFAWIDPKRILLKEPGTDSFIHYSIDGLVDFACRVAQEGGSSDGLLRLLGNPANGLAHVHVEGWTVHCDQIFRIKVNGNHRLTVLAALGVPCVLAEIEDNMGPFKAQPLPYGSQAEKIGLYRRLLHTYGVASFDQLGVAGSEVVTDWPILISSPREAVESLGAIEAMTGRGWYMNIGDLPRQWFDDHEFLDVASAGLHAHLLNYRRGWTNWHGSRETRMGRYLFKRKAQAVKKNQATDYGELPPR